MANTFLDRLKHSWNAFFSREPTNASIFETAHYGSYINPGHNRLLYRGSDRSLLTVVFGRIAVDCASINFSHVIVDENHNFVSTVDSRLNDILTVEANIDQTSRAFVRDIVLSMLDEGCVAVVPVDTDRDPRTTDSYDILSMRVGKIIEWYPYKVRVSLYNEREGKQQEVVVDKGDTAIIENPFYAIMNEPNSIYQRLLRVLSRLDIANDQGASGKLDLILQLPYVIKSEARQQQAEKRRRELEEQLAGSKYGIAYTDGTERVVQLNRSLENNYWVQAKDLLSTLYNQLGLTEDVFNGTANESTMINYYNRTIDPIMSAIAEEFERKFISKNARTRGQAIIYVRDPFRLVPVSQLADIADKFTRNEIMSSNEVRAEIGYRPVDDPRANELRNKNINSSAADESPETKEAEIQNEEV